MLDRQSRVNRHLKAGRSKVAKGAPGASEGTNGDVTYRQIGAQLNQYVKKDNSWEQVSGTGSKAQIIQTVTSSSSSSTSSGGGITDHDLLRNLTSGDDHTQYVHNTTARTISAQHSFTNSGSPFTVTSTSAVANLNADLLDGSEGSAYFKLADSETVTGIPAFNGGTSGSSSPFTVDSTQKVVNLNADQVDGKQPGTSAGDIAYYDSSTRVVDSQKLDGLDSASYFILSQNETVSGIPAFNGGTSGATAPFTVDSDYLVTNLNADKWDGNEFSDYINQAVRTTDSVAFGGLDLNGAATITGDLTHDASSGNFTITSTNGNTLIEGTTFTGNHVTIPGNLTVQGTTVTLDTSTLQVEDQNIYLAYNNAGDASTMNTAANAGGISLKAAEDKHFVWYSATDRWTASENIEAPGMYLKTNTETKITFEDTASSAISTIGTTNDGDMILAAPSTKGITINANNHFGGSTFLSGFAGSGWRITKDSANEYNAEFDNLIVRGTMSVYELLIQQIRATNGSLMITSADKVTEVANLGGSPTVYKFTIESDQDSGQGNNGNDFIHFTEGDLIIAQKWAGTSGNPPYSPVKRVRATVTETSNSSGSSLSPDEFKVTLYGSDSVAAADLPLDFVRIGNTSDTNRQGGVYITSEDSGAPFIDIFNDVSAWPHWRAFGICLDGAHTDRISCEAAHSDKWVLKTKARLGKLNGVTHEGTNLTGYGLYSENVFLTGKITATSGYIGTSDEGWTIASDQIHNGNFKLNANNERFQLGTITDFSNDDNTKQGIYMGKTSTGVYKIIIGKENAEYIEWDGSGLVVKGDITVSNPADFADTDATNGMNATESAQCVITNDGINLKNNSAVSLARFGAFNEDSTDKTVRAGVIGNSKSRLEIDNNGNLNIINRSSGGADSPVISLSNAGNATFTGTVTANDGYIGGSANGWNINSGHMVNGNVKLDAQNQLIKVGDVADFTNDDPNNKGILMGKDGSDYEFFVGKEGANDQIHWNGSTLAIKGDITVTNGGDFADTDATNGMNSAEENICVITNNGVEILNNNDDSLAEFSTSMRVGKIEDASSRLEVDSSGNLSIINRQGSIDTTTISLSNAGNASFTGAVTATSGTFTGAIEASSGNITGNMNVKAGLYVGTTSSTNGAIILLGSATGGGGYIAGGKGSYSSTSGGFWMGNAGTSSNAFNFHIGDANKYMKWDTAAGTLDIRGSLNADDITAGTITGRSVQTAASGNRIVLDGTNNRIKLIDGSAETAGSTKPERVIIDDDTSGYEEPSTYASLASETNLNVTIPSTNGWTTLGAATSTYTNYKGMQGTVRLEFNINTDPGDSQNLTRDVRWTVQGSTDNFSSVSDNLMEIQEFTSADTGNGNYEAYGSFSIGHYTKFRIRFSRRNGVGTGQYGPGSVTGKKVYWRLWDQNVKINNAGLNFNAYKSYARIGMIDTPDLYTDSMTTIQCKGGIRIQQGQNGDGSTAGGYNSDTSTWRGGNPLLITTQAAGSTTSFWAHFISAGNYYIWDDDREGGYINGSATSAQMNFTGQHRAIGNSGMTAEQYGAMIGYIVRADGKYNNIEDQGTVATINDSMPVIELSDSANDKRVFGVISSHEDTDGMREYDSGSWVTTMKKPEGDERVIINSLGEGAIWITNINGNLENGDYITSSTAAGLGQKQDDDLLHNYTVAKITQDCDFSSSEEFEHDGSTYKKQFVGCTYHCG